MKYEVGQLVKIIEDPSPVSLPNRYYVGLIVGAWKEDTYEILCVGDKDPEVFFESEIVGAIE